MITQEFGYHVWLLCFFLSPRLRSRPSRWTSKIIYQERSKLIQGRLHLSSYEHFLQTESLSLIEMTPSIPASYTHQAIRSLLRPAGAARFLLQPSLAPLRLVSSMSYIPRLTVASPSALSLLYSCLFGLQSVSTLPCPSSSGRRRRLAVSRQPHCIT
jgi:hypothetical protein